MHTRSADITEWLRERVTTTGARGLVVGLDGGLDSAVVAGLCRMALPDHVLGVLLPCHDDVRNQADAQLAAEHFHISTIRIDLAPAYDRLTSDLIAAASQLRAPHPVPLAAERADIIAQRVLQNVERRLRMTSLYFMANSLQYLVAGSGNRSEVTSGQFTKFGDGAADLLPLGDLLKSEVRSLARDLGVPPPLIDKETKAPLPPRQPNEGEIGCSDAQLERYLADGPDAVPPAVALRIERLVRQTAHKRSMPATPATGRGIE